MTRLCDLAFRGDQGPFNYTLEKTDEKLKENVSETCMIGEPRGLVQICFLKSKICNRRTFSDHAILRERAFEYSADRILTTHFFMVALVCQT